MNSDPNDPNGWVQNALGVGCLCAIGAAVALVAWALHGLHAHGWL